jgi:CheY-like chemotaxis protein
MIKERKILVVDDDDDLRQSLQEQLAMSGEFHVVTAETAAKGITLIKNEPPRSRGRVGLSNPHVGAGRRWSEENSSPFPTFCRIRS